MAAIFPFRAVRPAPTMAATVAAPPYDVVSAAEAAALAQDNPCSFLRVSRAEIELPAATDPYSPAVYEKAKANYARLRGQAPLEQEAQPAFYLYSLVREGHRQTGITAGFAVDDYEAEIIKKHEKTRRDKEDDRTRHILSLRSQTGPVFLTYRESAAIDRLAEQVMKRPPLYDFVAPDGISHTIWKIGDRAEIAQIQAAFKAIPFLYIADGHHRAASAARVRDQLRRDNPGHTGNEEYNRFLAVVFPAAQLRILPYNRVVKDLNGLLPAQLLEACRAHFDVSPAAGPKLERTGVFHAFLDQRWWRFAYTGNTAALSPMDGLDVSLLQNLILAPLLGIADPRSDKRIDFVGGIRGTAVLEERVRKGEAAIAFAMFPTTTDQLMAIADAGGIMPPKSTWFEPKLRDGLLIHDI